MSILHIVNCALLLNKSFLKRSFSVSIEIKIFILFSTLEILYLEIYPFINNSITHTKIFTDFYVSLLKTHTFYYEISTCQKSGRIL